MLYLCWTKRERSSYFHAYTDSMGRPGWSCTRGDGSEQAERYQSFAIKIVFSIHDCKSYSNYLRDGPNAPPFLPWQNVSSYLLWCIDGINGSPRVVMHSWGRLGGSTAAINTPHVIVTRPWSRYQYLYFLPGMCEVFKSQDYLVHWKQYIIHVCPLFYFLVAF